MIHILAIVLILVGIGLTFAGIYSIIEASKSKGWPSAEGTVSKSEVKETHWEDIVEYGVEIQYTYKVGDKHYLANRISWAFDSLAEIKKDEAEKKVSEYPQGKGVTVYYDPGNPLIAVLDTGLSLRVHIPWIIGILLLLVGLGLYYYGWM
jgi:hypothetical protein